MPNFPISYDNVDGASDYYATQLMTPGGENGKHAAYGGYLRDRPAPRAPLAGDWKTADLNTDIAQARSAGIDGFSVDIILPSTQSDVPLKLQAAAAATGNGFSIMPIADMAGPLGGLSPAAFVDEFARYLVSPAVTRLPDGRPVLSAFLAERQNVAWWTTVLTQLAGKIGKQVAFVPILLDANTHLETFAPISYGLSAWGGARSPGAADPGSSARGTLVDLTRRAHAAGRIWMAPIFFQDNRPSQGRFDEAVGSAALRNTWKIATDQSAEWTQMITWNDYAETTSFAPSLKHRWALLDLNAYFLTTFKWGPPTIVRDMVYVVHRTQSFAARPVYPTQRLMYPGPGSNAPQDTIEVVAFSTAAGYGAVAVSGAITPCSIPGRGVTTCNFPLGTGDIAAGIFRDNTWVAVTFSSNQVTSTPYVQDEQYVVASSGR
ncbi:glycoside hydrolase family 71 protein [Tsukamurella serpentis]